ncbi:sialate O-acetylesterase [Chenggangzhangella methanolivorans]|uniref:Sialate O-acetylesterase n=1 Tax=Chenggangzhangella methanolivorans TaxID=1437009 RepID=A0A9E6RA20_9HYPH|nr:sialate O-acetylesterase [Chenggangzhangella methanolivorans]QZN99573.1 sialate O-acetylesterase [Chenggangzhangella methanolivorans]
MIATGRAVLRAALLGIVACATTPSIAAETRLFVIAGQSNAVAAGGVLDMAPDLDAGATLPNVKIWKNDAAEPSFVIMRLGQNTVQYPALQHQHVNFGPEWGMAERYVETFEGDGARFFKFARGKTSLLNPDHWSPDGPSTNLYGQMRAHLRTIAAEGHVASCFVWVQGEADRAKDGDLYEAAFRRLIAGVETALGQTEMTIVWPRLSQRRDNTETARVATENFRAMQTRIAGDPALRVRLVDVDDLAKRDNVHFDATSVRTLGRRVMKRCLE